MEHKNVEDSVLQGAEHSLPDLPKLNGLNIFSETKWDTLTWSDTDILWQMERSSLVLGSHFSLISILHVDMDMDRALSSLV